jgi:hypothetical protein
MRSAWCVVTSAVVRKDEYVVIVEFERTEIHGVTKELLDKDDEAVDALCSSGIAG